MAVVSVKKTCPEMVVADYHEILKSAGYKNQISPKNKTILKLNLSWTLFFPACSTPPWQLDGVLKTLKDANYQDILAVENKKGINHPWKGAYLNKWLPILEKHGTLFEPLESVKWVEYQPKSEMMVLDKVMVPEIFLDSNVIHFPTMKTHGHTTITGAMRNVWGGIIASQDMDSPEKIHEVLVDLLAIQQELHSGVMAVMDGGVCGNGSGPRAMVPSIGNIIMASSDQVAIDAVAAKIMGFDPLSIDYIKMAHDNGLGIGDVDEIEIVGMDKSELNELNFNFKATLSPVISWDQRIRKQTSTVKWLNNFLFNSSIYKALKFASDFYYDHLWYPFLGTERLKMFHKTKWGELFRKYEYGSFSQFKEVEDWDPY
ncbi:DUF362 domain-containing protein [Methanobacterium alcaliphilum]|uniref:DUF362 domain-containing protein n=1 Tax=Methanobacterium alcaliphilum TaxID=392018 RepID=UPI00200B48D7|nr:DUF362 domain-containing protein [Methanobacterium alcaliphilum]MCK9150696.1 DUF362 domain-containing protein [Methanobacterium alcaliphilum]